MTKHILLVDDDALMRRSLAFGLTQAGYRMSSAANAEDALTLSQRDPPDLVLLDIGLPGMDGLDALRYFKAQIGAPVIFLTARRSETDEILGLELGADDYLTKPVNLSRLLAHVKAVLRRSEADKNIEAERPPIILGDLIVDPGAHTVMVAGRTVDLRPARVRSAARPCPPAQSGYLHRGVAGKCLGSRVQRGTPGSICPHPLAAPAYRRRCGPSAPDHHRARGWL